MRQWCSEFRSALGAKPLVTVGAGNTVRQSIDGVNTDLPRADMGTGSIPKVTLKVCQST